MIVLRCAFGQHWLSALASRQKPSRACPAGPNLLPSEVRGKRTRREERALRSRTIITASLVLGATLAAAAEIPGKIAFIGLDHQVYIADPNGGEPRALTRGEAGRMAA